MKNFSKIAATAGLLGLGTLNSCSTNGDTDFPELELSSSSSDEIVIIDPPQEWSSSSKEIIIDPPTPVLSSSRGISSSSKGRSSSSEAVVIDPPQERSSSSEGVSSSSIASSSSEAKLSSSSIATSGDGLKFYTNVNIHKWAAGEWIDGKTYEVGAFLETAPSYSKTGEFPAGDTLHVKVSNGTTVKVPQDNVERATASGMCSGLGYSRGVIDSNIGIGYATVGVKLPDEICNNR